MVGADTGYSSWSTAEITFTAPIVLSFSLIFAEVNQGGIFIEPSVTYSFNFVTAPTITIPDAPTVYENSSGTAEAVFAVTLSAASQDTITVDYTTQDGTAQAGTDYQAESGTLTFAPGQTTATIGVPVIGTELAQ